MPPRPATALRRSSVRTRRDLEAESTMQQEPDVAAAGDAHSHPVRTNDDWMLAVPPGPCIFQHGVDAKRPWRGQRPDWGPGLSSRRCLSPSGSATSSPPGTRLLECPGRSAADVAELADALDSKSGTRKGVWVRPPPSAPLKIKGEHCCDRFRFVAAHPRVWPRIGSTERVAMNRKQV